MYGFIYITTNHINGKKYIGQKKYDKYNHWKTYLGSEILLSRAINKYGRENFSKEIIEECETRDKLNAREKYWIFYHDAVNSDKFYNLASGGDGGRTCYGETHHASKKVYQYDKDGIFLREWDNAQRASEELGICVSDIYVVCRNNNDVKQAGGYQWSYIKFDILNTKIKPYTGTKCILQLDSDFNIIQEYDNVSCIDSNLFNKERVTNCCNFRAITHNGYHWVYKESFNKDTINTILAMKNKKPKDVTSKVVYQLDANKNIVHTYKNSKEASDITGIKKGTIQAYCKRNVANHGFNTTGYYWVYDVA